MIGQYLEEKFQVGTTTQTPEARAHLRLLRVFTFSIGIHRSRFVCLSNPKNRDEKVVNEKLSESQGRLELLETMLASPGNFAAGAEFTLADCALAPTMFFVTNMLPGFAEPPLESRPKLTARWTKVQTRPSMSKALGEMGVALKAMMGLSDPHN